MPHSPRWRKPALASLCLSTLLLPAISEPASAHPHVFIDDRVKAVFTGGQLVGFFLDWRFDDLSTVAFLQQPPPASGTLSPQAVDRIKHYAFESLHRYDYFVHIQQGKRPIPIGQATQFTARLDGKRLVYDFFVPLATPLDLRHQSVVASFFDATNYTAFVFPENDPHPVALVGSPSACAATVNDDDTEEVTITCA